MPNSNSPQWRAMPAQNAKSRSSTPICGEFGLYVPEMANIRFSANRSSMSHLDIHRQQLQRSHLNYTSEICYIADFTFNQGQTIQKFLSLKISIHVSDLPSILLATANWSFLWSPFDLDIQFLQMLLINSPWENRIHLLAKMWSTIGLARVACQMLKDEIWIYFGWAFCDLLISSFSN